MSNTGGILLLIGGGVLVYFLLKNGNLANLGINPIMINEKNQTISLNPKASLTPSIVETLQKNIPDLTGSQVTSFIHGGSIGGYRGTNGKIYADYEDAKRNGAV